MRNSLIWKEWAWYSEAQEEGEKCIRVITVGDRNGRIFYMSSIVDCSIGKEIKLLGHAINLEEAKQIHEDDREKRIKESGFGE